METVQINRKGAARLRSGHPWIFQSDVTDRGEAQPGSIVRVADPTQKPLGFAHFSQSSQITLRFLGTTEPGPDFYRERIRAAARHRERVVQDSDSYRLIFAEADFLPALIIDRYGAYFTVQALNQGMDRALPAITEALIYEFQPAGILARNDAAVRSLEELPREIRVLHGDIPEAITVHMNGFAMEADLAHGQKTGVFLDQRENYVAAASYARGRALDCFTSTGGFALHLAARCEQVEAVDSSERALATARRNFAANNVSNVQITEADAFDLLTGYAASRRQFDTIVLDPPAFAKSRGQVDGALRGYKDINQRAMRMLSPGGVLITNSCSHHLGEADFLGLLAQAAIDAGRTVRVLERRMQGRDHPVLLTVPETLYLKCLILEVL